MNKKRLLSVAALALVITLTGCAAIGTYFSKLTGSLFGKGYTITQYDNYGQQPTGGFGGYAQPASAPASDFAMLDDDDAQLPF